MKLPVYCSKCSTVLSIKRKKIFFKKGPDLINGKFLGLGGGN
jgi:hypothetical protein